MKRPSTSPTTRRPIGAIHSGCKNVRSFSALEVAAGTTISYGGTYRCETDKRIAVVSLGYADGVSRTLSNRGFLLCNGKRAPILGRICMDHLMIDADRLGKIECGMPAYIIGGGSKGNTVDELAELEGTISYEVLCRMVGSRVKKIYTE
jgi:alanine racemase